MKRLNAFCLISIVPVTVLATVGHRWSAEYAGQVSDNARATFNPATQKPNMGSNAEIRYTGIDNAFRITADVSGVGRGTGVALVNIPYDTAAQSGFGTGLSVQNLNYGGVTAAGGRMMGQFLFNQTFVDGQKDGLSDFVGILGGVSTATGNNGTLAHPRGDYYGGWFVSHLKRGAVHTGALEGIEVNVAADVGSSVVHKTGIVISHGGAGSDEIQGSEDDSMLWIFSGPPSSQGSKVGVQFGWNDGSIGYGVSPQGSLIATRGAYTVGNGVDVSSARVTGCAWKSKNTCVNGDGDLSIKSVKATTYYGKLMTPKSSSAPCQPGQFSDDTQFHYVCIGKDKWRRSALSDF